MRRRDKSIWMAILIGILGLAIGFFIGTFLESISQNVGFLGFLRFLNHSVSFGLDVAPNLIFATIALGFSINLSVMGAIVMAVFLVIYFRR
jgi:hypothetical protein